MCAAPIVYERNTISSSGSPAATRTSTRPNAPVSASMWHARTALAPDGASTHVSSRVGSSVSDDRSTPPASSAPSTSTACSASPTARSIGADRRARDRRPRANARRPRTYTATATTPNAGAPPRATTPSISTRAVARHRGRGDRRTLRPEAHDVFPRVDDPHGRAEPVGELTRRAGRGRIAACRRTRRRSRSGEAGAPPASHHDASGSRYAGSTHEVASRTPSGGHVRQRGRTAAAAPRPSCAGPAPCRPRSRASSNDARDHPLHPGRAPIDSGERARRQRHRDQRVARRSVVGEGRAAERNVGAHRLRDAAFQLRAAGRGREITRAADCASIVADRVVHREPTRAPAEMRGQRAVEIAAPSARRAHHDARRAEPALRAAGRDERRGQPITRRPGRALRPS